MSIKDEKLLGIDVGDATIGLAFGSAGLTLPLKTISGKNLENAFSEIIRLSFENKITKIVVGLPVLPSGKPTQQTLKVKDFVKRLKLKIKIPLVLTNEFLSTKEALGKAMGYGVSKKARSSLDSFAAEIILKRYYDETKT